MTVLRGHSFPFESIRKKTRMSIPNDFVRYNERQQINSSDEDIQSGSASKGCRPARISSNTATTFIHLGNTKSGESREEVSTSPGIPRHFKDSHSSKENTQIGESRKRVSTSPSVLYSTTSQNIISPHRIHGIHISHQPTKENYSETPQHRIRRRKLIKLKVRLLY